MNKILTIVALLSIVGVASADTVSNSTNIPVTSNTGVDARNQSVSTATGSDLSHAVGAAMAPSLTTTLTETCMGSTSAGAGFAGGSFSFGTTWRDSACVRRLDAREIKSFGDIQAAKEIMCDSEKVREAFKRVGRPCAEDGGVYTVVAQTTTDSTTARPTLEEAAAIKRKQEEKK